MCILIKFLDQVTSSLSLSRSHFLYSSSFLSFSWSALISLVCLLPVSQATFDIKGAFVAPATEYQVYAMQAPSYSVARYNQRLLS